MPVKVAITVINDIAVDYDVDVIDALLYIRDNLTDFNGMEQLAYRILSAEFSKLIK